MSSGSIADSVRLLEVNKPPFNDPGYARPVSDGVEPRPISKHLRRRGNWNNWRCRMWLDPRGPDMGPGAKFYKYDPAGRSLLPPRASRMGSKST